MNDENLQAEIARLRAGEADTPPPEGTTPTPAQWIRLWNDLPAEQRLKWAERILGNAEQASRCFLMNHDVEIEELHERLEVASRRLTDARPKPTSKSKRAAVTGEPRMFANEIQAILNDLGLTHVVAKISATTRPEPDSHNAMVFLSDQATEDTTNQLVGAFTERGWAASPTRSNTKIYVYVRRVPDEISAPSGETP
ncbi:hypothetical protein OG884_18755 [Streptosporangium sp. NBC_01755]|uniref:hypothetical protein n=1 Tax=Streptosporangium sp. NBC_01755 TaxID=2975949 RepID=UPI002DDA78DE|nr:hypothetical protein [Streptosporangium sp. NBC_01755]WSD01447.1 hypothetical protein OG884_05840 [Streptosporangium sp. NBC_01755]WSD03849.1 hypothetical protein OG884_18755 [Streptosporangium sp. NBC_01755]